MSLQDSQDNNLAARIYEELAKIRDWSLAPSPGWRIDPRKANGMDSIRTGLDEVIKSVRQTSGRVWEAPSAWHAALYLSMLQHQMLTRGSRVLFRGHRCEDWDLSPSILRPGVDQEREERRGKAFGRLLASLSFNTGRIMSRDLDLYLRISPNSYLAAAQHYGIKTHLLDFTTDPDVAVWFATNGGDSNNGWACVHILPLDVKSDSGQAIVLPPPFIRRLYLQRGMFLLADTAFERKEMMTLRFPWHPSDSELKEFRVLRDGGGEVDLLPDETSLTPVLELADRVVDGELKADSQGEIDALAYSLKAHFPQAYWNLGQMWAEYVDAFEEVLYAIAFDFNESGMLVCDQSRLAAIARNNAETCGSVAAFYRALPKLAGPVAEIPADKLAWQKRLADILDEIIAHECGYDHKAEARGYADWMGLHLDGREPK